MTSLFYRLYPKDAAIPDHTVTPAARWAKILANGGTLPEKEDDGNQTQEETISEIFLGHMETQFYKPVPHDIETNLRTSNLMKPH